jgi:hypothetical protein
MGVPMSKQARYRARLRAQGLRPVQIWVPDVRRPGFVAECARQSRVVAQGAGEADAVAWAERAATTVAGWE